MSSFQRSTIAASCLSACEIQRAHIFEEGLSPPPPPPPPGASGAKVDGDVMLEKAGSNNS
jgi:hypothetical protein